MIDGLDGIRVVDVTTNVAGPQATQILGDLGADVIKVERPGGGDDTRSWAPPQWPDGESITFSTLNRNKRSVVLDLSSPDDVTLFDSLLREADIVVQNMRPGAFAGLGYTWERLQELNPRLIYGEITGFGAVGPRAAEPAYDPLMQAFSGLMSLTGEAGRSPVRIPVSLLDKGSGMWLVIGLLNALRLRDRTGRGSHVQTSLLETALQWEPLQLMNYLATGVVPAQAGSAAPGIAPYQAFAASDGHLVIAAGNQRLWLRLCTALEHPEWAEDERFLTNELRVRNMAVLVELLTSVVTRQTVAFWVERLSAHGVPCTPIRRIDEVVQDEQVAALGMLEPLALPDGGAQTQVLSPLLTDGQRFEVRLPPPRLDAHGAAVRQELGSPCGARPEEVAP